MYARKRNTTENGKTAFRNTKRKVGFASWFVSNSVHCTTKRQILLLKKSIYY